MRLDGVLVGGSLATGRFELRTSADLIRGRATGAAKEDLKAFHLGDRVIALVREVTARHEGSVTTPFVSYVAEGFVPPTYDLDSGADMPEGS